MNYFESIAERNKNAWKKITEELEKIPQLFSPVIKAQTQFADEQEQQASIISIADTQIKSRRNYDERSYPGARDKSESRYLNDATKPLEGGSQISELLKNVEGLNDAQWLYDHVVTQPNMFFQNTETLQSAEKRIQPTLNVSADKVSADELSRRFEMDARRYGGEFALFE